MNINLVCVRSNGFAEIKTIIGDIIVLYKYYNRWAPANEIVVCALVPPTTRETGVLSICATLSDFATSH